MPTAQGLVDLTDGSEWACYAMAWTIDLAFLMSFPWINLSPPQLLKTMVSFSDGDIQAMAEADENTHLATPISHLFSTPPIHPQLFKNRRQLS